MIDQFQYITLTIIDCEIDICVSELTSYIEDGRNKKYCIEKRPINLQDIYNVSPPSGGAHFSKFLLWEPQNLLGKTVFFSNYEDGKYTLILNYCRTFNCKAISIAISNQETIYPAFNFYYFDFSHKKNIERTISLIKDGKKWAFFSKGEVQHFENISNYENKLKIKRINKGIILSYLLKLGIDIENDKFWRSTSDAATYFNQVSW